jgi:hypothetical protein
MVDAGQPNHNRLSSPDARVSFYRTFKRKEEFRFFRQDRVFYS